MNISTLIINIGFKSKILTQKIMEKKKQKKWKAGKHLRRTKKLVAAAYGCGGAAPVQ